MPSVHQVVYAYQDHLAKHTIADAVNETIAEFLISASDIVGAFNRAELDAKHSPEEIATIVRQRDDLLAYLKGQEGHG
jgi:hypothetical protein